MESLSATTNFFTNTLLYKEFLEEKEEILKHKWIESEKKGFDIGFDNALIDWVLKYRTAWRKWRKHIYE